MSIHADCAAVLLAPTFACPPGLKAWNGSDPAARFGVHRNNVIVSLVDAVADSYPVVQALVGDAFFRAMAAEFVRHSPPSSPVLAWYGSDFPDFVGDFPPAVSLPYLADVARLEWLRVEAWHAADVMPLAESDWQALLADETRLSSTCFVFHPAVRLLRSAYPVVSIWAAHQAEDSAAVLPDIDLQLPESALLARPELGVEIIPVEASAADFIGRLHSGMPLAQAAAIGEVDLIATLSLLIRTRSVVGIVPVQDGLIHKGLATR